MTDTTTTQLKKVVKPRGKNSKQPKRGGTIPHLTKKSKRFAELYVETENGTQSALETYNTDSYTVAGAIATENLKKPLIQSYIQELIANQITDEDITALHVRNAKQTVNYPTSQKAIESLEIIRGLVKEKEKSQGNTVNIAVINPDIMATVKVFEESLKRQLYGK